MANPSRGEISVAALLFLAFLSRSDISLLVPVVIRSSSTKQRCRVCYPGLVSLVCNICCLTATDSPVELAWAKELPDQAPTISPRDAGRDKYVLDQ
ncbi:hypothetical protein F5Y04DRAFT_264602 [Hypomontagnella monticulosa]|nr:hypothetical protein F5Y04DRAFT_264602 [Hypomontagnella monticulosa]